MHHTITDLLPRRVELISVGYDDNLDGRHDELQECIRLGEWTPIDEVLFEWCVDYEYESAKYYLDELTDDIARAFDVEPERAKRFVEAHDDELRDELFDRDTSKPLHDLLHNTRDIVAFYDTGVEFDETWALDKREFAAAVGHLRRALHIKGDVYDAQLEELLANASSGGRLVVYFNIEMEGFVGIEANTITFGNPYVAIIDTYHGSGHDVYLPGHTFSLPYDRANVFLDRTIKYNYTYAVCGMSSDWCGMTDVKLSVNPKRKVKAARSSLNSEQAREAQYKATYRAGGCTAGDMDIRRHRGVYYLNEFPCGSHCSKCGTFWID